MPGLLVTGTDTGVGKSILTAALVAALRSHGVDVAALKPVATGLVEPQQSIWPPDHELLAGAAGCLPEDVVAATYGPAVSPHLAAELAGIPLDVAAVLERIEAAACAHEVLVVEGVGGLLVPLRGAYDIKRLAQDAGLPLLIAARAGLGTINHTLLTLESARHAGLEVVAVVLTPWPATPGVIERSNRETIERLGEVDVWTLPEVAHPGPDALAAAGATLPLARWIGAAVR